MCVCVCVCEGEGACLGIVAVVLKDGGLPQAFDVDLLMAARVGRCRCIRGGKGGGAAGRHTQQRHRGSWLREMGREGWEERDG